MILDDLFAAAADFDTDKLAAIVHPDVRFSEMPNLINPEGTERDRDEALRRLRARAASCSQRSPTTCTSASTTATRSRRA